MIICFVKISIKVIQIEKSFHICFSVYKRGKPPFIRTVLKKYYKCKNKLEINFAPQSIDYPDIGGSTETLLTNSPNPFNGSTVISYYGTIRLRCATPWLIEIYNIKGQKIRTLECSNRVNAKATRSLYSITWNGKDENSKLVASGIYFFTLKSNNFILETRKMILLRMK